jgi:hypothetical protein
MATSRSPRKGRERQAAALFGARRQVLSGSAGRPDRPASGSTHERNFLEIRLRQIHAVRTLLDVVRDSARRVGKIPVLGLATKDRAGLLLVIDSLDMPRPVTEFAAADSDLGSGREDRFPFSGARKEA